jgi:ABC-type antimicrobial peptide transport system permease subunit
MEYSTITDYPDAALILSSDMPEQIGTRLIEGRNFDKRDSATGLKSIVVSDYIAKTYWPGQSALGKRMRLLDENGGTQEQRVVVGVISNVRRGENVLLTDKSTFAALYVPFAQSAISTASILVRHSGSESSVGATMMQAVSTIDPYVVPAPPTNFTESQKKLTLVATTMTSLFIQCGIFAILLAMTGIYGLSSNNVIRRTHEIGLRRAIGATDNSIIRLFMKEGGRQLTFGFVISALISIAILFMLLRFAGIDAATLTVIGVLVLLVITALVMIAIYIATRRVVGQEPSEALRYD